MKRYIAIFLIIFLLVGCNSNKLSNDIKNKTEKKEKEVVSNIPSIYQDNGIFKDYYDKAYNKFKTMTIEEKIGQMLLVRMDYNNVDSIINDYNVSGFIMFANDFKDKTKDEVKNDIIRYQSISRIPLLIAVDEEGGSVVRVSRYKNFRNTPFESPQDIYNKYGMEGIISDTLEKSELLKSVGINLNLAPVADISENKEDFIYDRTFGSDATNTSLYIKNVVEEYNKNNMASCLKHFPGYGNNIDTHTGVAVDKRDYNTFVENDFKPFIAGINAKVPTILVSHNIVETMDTIPASLSSKVHSILRDELKFTGVIMTDDLDMDAIKKYVDNPNVKAVTSGNNLLITSDYKTSFNDILNAYNNNEISVDIIDKAVFKVLALKYSMGVLND